MSRLIRLGLVAAGVFVSLAFTGSALASYAPSLTVTSSVNAPGKPTSILLGHIQSAADDPTFRDTLYTPLGYGVNLSQAPGTKIGNVSARLILRSGGNAEVDADGQVVADSPGNWTTQAAQCTDGHVPIHEAVWRLDITVAGVALQLPVFVDRVTTAPENAFAVAKIQFCFLPPGTAPDAQVEFAFFDVNGVFTTPSSTSDHVWNAIFTPYVAGQPVPNPAGTTEGQAVVPGRVGLTMKTKSLKRGVVIVSGRLLVDGQAFGGALVELYTPGRSKRIGKARTNGRGNYSIRIKVKKKRTIVLAQVFFLGDLQSCPAPPIPLPPPAVTGCKTATVSFFATKIAIARKRK